MKSLASTLALLMALMSVSTAFAQTNFSILNLSGQNENASITASPQNPAPGDTVSLTLQDTSVDLSDSTVVWRSNGTTIAQGTGMTSTNVTAGPLGSHMNIVASVTALDGTQVQAQSTISPTEVDLLMDSNTYVPPFYKGRALPSAGTPIRVQAIVYFKRADGTLVPSSQINYTWKENDVVLGNLSGLGRSSVLLPAPPLDGSTVVEIDTESQDGDYTGSASLLVPAANPQIVLYQDHPLFGITYYNGFASSASIPGSQTTFAAVPYFAQAQSPNDSNLTYAWTINDSPVKASAQDPSEITINAANSSGQAQLALEVTHATNIFLDAKSSWNFTFGSVGSGSSGSGSTESAKPDSGNLFNSGL